MKEMTDDVKLELGWVLLDIGENQAGLALYSSLPWNIYGEEKYCGMSRALTEMGRYYEAENLLQNGLQRYPQSCSLWVAMGGLPDSIGNHSESLKCFEIALRFASEKDFKSVYYDKAVALMKMGCYCDASKIIEYLIEEYPEDPKYLAERGCCALEMGYFQESLSYYQKALQLYEKSPSIEAGVSAYTGLCSSYLNLGMKKEAVEIALEGYRRFQDEDPILYHNLGACFYELGWIRESREVLQKGIEKFPDDQELKTFLKDVQNDLDDPDGDTKPFLGLLILVALLHKKLKKKW
jgi:tetratricopeptide (TPR) repeat protein